MDWKSCALGATALAITLAALATLWWTVIGHPTDPAQPDQAMNSAGVAPSR
jgi:hypothetical protein